MELRCRSTCWPEPSAFARFAVYGLTVYGGYGTAVVNGERFAAFFAFGAAREQHGRDQTGARADQRAEQQYFSFVFHENTFLFFV